MATKKTSFSDKAKDAQEMVLKAFSQAKDSLKLLEALEKEAVAKAKNYVKIPNAEETVKQANEILVSSLSKAGLATTAEVAALEARIAALEAQAKETAKALAEATAATTATGAATKKAKAAAATSTATSAEAQA